MQSNADIYKQRRQWLMSQLDDNAVVVLVGNKEVTRNKNINFRFRQDHDFYYFSGFDQPDAVLVIRPRHEKPFTMFVQPKDEFQEVWFAQRAGVSGAIEQYGADQAFSVEDIDTKLPQLFEERTDIYWSDELGRFNDRVFDWLKRQRMGAKFDEVKRFRHLKSVLPITQNIRRVKDNHEVSLIRNAAKASVEGHKTLMRLARPGITEQEMAAAFYKRISELGCNDVGYPTILASGHNACCLHYDVNSSTLADNELVLVDAGGEYNYYTADITRTYPVNGRFTSQQKELYQLVLNATDAAIEGLKPGVSWNSIYPTAMRVLTQGLIDLGILNMSFDQAWQTEAYKSFTLHKTGHFMGLDVHDVGSYRESNGDWIELEKNMVFTVEPGLYFPNNCLQVNEKWRGMGVRVEDDILITDFGHENLSIDAPRTVTEIEQIMQEGDS